MTFFDMEDIHSSPAKARNSRLYSSATLFMIGCSSTFPIASRGFRKNHRYVYGPATGTALGPIASSISPDNPVRIEKRKLRMTRDRVDVATGQISPLVSN